MKNITQITCVTFDEKLLRVNVTTQLTGGTCVNRILHHQRSVDGDRLISLATGHNESLLQHFPEKEREKIE